MERGENNVIEIDVGNEKLNERLRKDKRVKRKEGVNEREMEIENMEKRDVDCIVQDVRLIQIRMEMKKELDMDEKGDI